jgi:GNAT superfamily N-acetyltransferase
VITPLDVTDDSTVDWAYRLKVACEPADPEEGAARFGTLLRHLPAGDRQWVWRAGDDGFALLRVPDGCGSGWVRLFVDPARRHRGTGQALCTALLDQARSVGCRIVRGWHTSEDAARFCTAVGAVEGVANRRGLLIMPAQGAGVPVDGYTLRSWVGRTPEELLDDMVDARDAINDAPSSPGEEPDRFTPDRVRAFDEAVLARGLQQRQTVGLDATGRIVGFTELRVGPEADALATTEDTAVVVSHRGRGLATWIKAESLRLLARDRPDVTRVVTDNAETNAAMLAVNAKLGFRTIARWRLGIVHIVG